MIKLIIPDKKGRIKTPCRGWYSGVYDYNNVLELPYTLKDSYTLSRFYFYLTRLKDKNCQECLFYEYNGQGFIYYNSEKVLLLRNKKTLYHYKFRGLKDFVKKLLLDYGGLTVYKDGDYYRAEIFYN